MKELKKRNQKYNISIGHKIRSLRLKNGHSQEDIAKHLGITYQQIQKYESGRSRIPAFAIPILTDLLKTEYSAFFPERNNVAATPESALDSPRYRDDEIARIVYILRQTEDHRFLRSTRALIKTLVDEFTG